MEYLMNLQKDFTKNVIGYSALGIILSTCLGSVAIYQIVPYGNGFLPMALILFVVAICSAHNAAILTVQKPSLIFKLLIASSVSSLLIIAGSFLIG